MKVCTPKETRFTPYFLINSNFLLLKEVGLNSIEKDVSSFNNLDNDFNNFSKLSSSKEEGVPPPT